MIVAQSGMEQGAFRYKSNIQAAVSKETLSVMTTIGLRAGSYYFIIKLV